MKTQLSKLVQSGGVICDILIFGNILSNIAKTDIARNLGIYFLDKQTDKFKKEYITGNCSGITLTNNEIQDIMKVIKWRYESK